MFCLIIQLSLMEKLKEPGGEHFKKDKVTVEINLFVKLNSTQNKKLINAVKKFGKFLNLPVEIIEM